MIRIIILAFLAHAWLIAMEPNEAEQKIDTLEKPLYKPFVERYLMDSIKDTRIQMEKMRVEMYDKVTQKELKVADSAISYATSTINNMFYIIAAASSVLVLLGWSSLKDMREKLKESINEQVGTVIKRNEDRLAELEKNLAERSRQVLQNQEDIAKTNAVHSLWMRAGLESNPQSRIEIYDQILAIRDKDAEVVSYKADAALELGESNWALNLANEAIANDPEYPNAYYQRACAYSVMGYDENAISDLEKALELNEHYIEEMTEEKDFDPIRDVEGFQSLISKYSRDENEANSGKS